MQQLFLCCFLVDVHQTLDQFTFITRQRYMGGKVLEVEMPLIRQRPVYQSLSAEGLVIYDSSGCCLVFPFAKWEPMFPMPSRSCVVICKAQGTLSTSQANYLLFSYSFNKYLRSPLLYASYCSGYWGIQQKRRHTIAPARKELTFQGRKQALKGA